MSSWLALSVETGKLRNGEDHSIEVIHHYRLLIYTVHNDVRLWIGPDDISLSVSHMLDLTRLLVLSCSMD